MTQSTLSHLHPMEESGRSVVDFSSAGRYVALYGIVLVFTWIGAMKFTAYEAGAIQGLVQSSPMLAWLYGVLTVQGVSNLIGVIEITAAALLALRPWSTIAGALGAGLVIATTVTTLTFLITVPGWEASLGGFPALSVVPGQFLVKDVVLLGAALWLLGESVTEFLARR